MRNREAKDIESLRTLSFLEVLVSQAYEINSHALAEEGVHGPARARIGRVLRECDHRHTLSHQGTSGGGGFRLGTGERLQAVRHCRDLPRQDLSLGTIGTGVAAMGRSFLISPRSLKQCPSRRLRRAQRFAPLAQPSFDWKSESLAESRNAQTC